LYTIGIKKYEKCIKKQKVKLTGWFVEYTVVGFFLIKYGGEVFLDEFFSVRFLLRDWGEASLER
jgi:hypothetical protein